MSPRDLRAQYNAARTLDRSERSRERMEQRARMAAAVLANALGDRAEVRVPGYRVTRTNEGIRVAPLPSYDAAQLALWREMAQEQPR